MAQYSNAANTRSLRSLPHPLPVPPRGVEAHPGPFLYGEFQVVAVAGEIDRVAVHVHGQPVGLLALALAAGGLVGEGESAGGVDVGGRVEGLGLVFGLKSAGQHLNKVHGSGWVQSCRVWGCAAVRAEGRAAHCYPPGCDRPGVVIH